MFTRKIAEALEIRGTEGDNEVETIVAVFEGDVFWLPVSVFGDDSDFELVITDVVEEFFERDSADIENNAQGAQSTNTWLDGIAAREESWDGFWINAWRNDFNFFAHLFEKQKTRRGGCQEVVRWVLAGEDQDALGARDLFQSLLFRGESHVSRRNGSGSSLPGDKHGTEELTMPWRSCQRLTGGWGNDKT